MLALVSCLLELGWVHYAMAVLLGFDCTLRTIELTSIRSANIHVLSGGCLLYLGVTNTRHKQGSIDSVQVRDEKLCKLLRRYLNKFPEDFPLVGRPDHFRRVVKAIFKSLGLEDAGFQLYGIRRGSATDF